MDIIEGGYINYASSIDNRQYPVHIKYIDTLRPGITISGEMEYIPDMEDFIPDYQPEARKTLWEMICEYEEKEKFFFVQFIVEEDMLKCYLVLQGYLDELKDDINLSKEIKEETILMVQKFQKLLKKHVYKTLNDDKNLNKKYNTLIKGPVDILTDFSDNENINILEKQYSNNTYKPVDDNQHLSIFGL